MIKVYTLEEVDREILQPLGWTDGVRWLKRRIAAGQIPGKRLSRNVFVMTEKHVDLWLHGEEPTPAAKPVADEDSPAEPDVRFLASLSSVSNRRRIKAPK